MKQEYYLKQKQSLPLDAKIILAKKRIKEFYSELNGKVYVSFSGGKDSTVLLHLVRSIYPNVEAVFMDTGLEFPEIIDFVKTFDNVAFLKPTKKFNKVIKENGYPYPSKKVARQIFDLKYSTDYMKNLRLNGTEKGNSGKISKKWIRLKDAPFEVSKKCCDYLKIYPVRKYERKSLKRPFIGTMANESSLRKDEWLKHQCNNLDSKLPTSKPLSIFLEEDIWEYLKRFNVPYSKIYDMGYKRTGCMFCLFGIHLEPSNLFEKNRIQMLKETHPKQYEYIIEKLNFKKLLEHERINYK